MQNKINNDVQLAHYLNPLNDIVKVSGIDNSSDLKDGFTKIDKQWKYGNKNIYVTRYLPGMTKVWHQGQI